MKLAAGVMEHTQAYRLWQAPFAEKKFAPVLAHNDLRSVRRVLDVGCGPGTNTHHFRDADYLGIDRNAAYIDYARRRYKRDFLVADVTQYSAPKGEGYDFILLNSVLHHIDLPGTLRILSHLCMLLTHEGHVHILELVLSGRRSIARFLACWDRGAFPRPLQEWQEVLGETFEPVVFEPFEVTGLGAKLWDMVYFKGRARG
jgi:SAM-dependent methyltransferase